MIDALLNSAGGMAIVGIMLAASILYALWRGTALLAVLTVALPIAAFLYTVFPYDGIIRAVFGSWTPLAAFLGLLALATWVVTQTLGSGFGGSRPMHILAVSVALTLSIVVIAHQILGLGELFGFNASLESFFSAPASLFWIIALGLVALFLV